MKWYGASVVIWMRKKDYEPNKPCQFWENIILVHAATPEEALAKAESRGRLDAVKDDTMRIDGEPAELEYVGIRKMIEVMSLDNTDQPVDGAEITYSLMIAANRAALVDFATGKEADITHIE